MDKKTYKLFIRKNIIREDIISKNLINTPTFYKTSFNNGATTFLLPVIKP